MAVRAPFYYDGSGFREMTTTEVAQWTDRAIYHYSLAPSIVLTVVASGGSLGTINDTRKTAGAHLSYQTRYPFESELPEPGTVTVGYARISQGSGPSAQVGDTNSVAYPLYNDGNNLRAMSQTDMLDTFIRPGLTKLMSASTSASTTAGTYTISSATSLADHTRISSTPVYSNTRANTAAYTAAGIPESLDQPTTLTNYYLYRRNGVANTPTRNLMYLDTSGNAQEYSLAASTTLLGEWLKWAAIFDTPLRIRYRLNGAGTIRGSNMQDTRLNGAGNRQTRFVNSNDYRAQEFPNGTNVAVANNYLRIYQV
tara:strand:+ start:4485 stop:5417 length:933 start_codon:yes stop_codon:yes gene_type:complete